MLRARGLKAGSGLNHEVQRSFVPDADPQTRGEADATNERVGEFTIETEDDMVGLQLRADMPQGVRLKVDPDVDQSEDVNADGREVVHGGSCGISFAQHVQSENPRQELTPGQQFEDDLSIHGNGP